MGAAARSLDLYRARDLVTWAHLPGGPRYIHRSRERSARIAGGGPLQQGNRLGAGHRRAHREGPRGQAHAQSRSSEPHCPLRARYHAFAGHVVEVEEFTAKDAKAAKENQAANCRERARIVWICEFTKFAALLWVGDNARGTAGLFHGAKTSCLRFRCPP